MFIILLKLLSLSSVVIVNVEPYPGPLTSKKSPLTAPSNRDRRLDGPPGHTAKTTFEFSALDCRHPSALHSTSFQDACKTREASNEKIGTHEITLLQTVKSFSTRALRCQKIRTRFDFACGVWAHSKIMTPPDIGIPESVSEQECQSIAGSHIFIDETQRSHQVPRGRARLFYKYVTGGTLTTTHDSVSCTGGVLKVDGKEHTDVLELNSVELRIDEIEVATKENGDLIDVENHEILPSNCHTGSTCHTITAAYTFPDRRERCPFFKIKTLHADLIQIQTEEENPLFLLVSNNSKIAIPLPSLQGVAAPSHCSDYFDIYSVTKYSDLAVVFSENVRDLSSLKEVSGPEVNLDLETKVSDNYLSFNLRRIISKDILRVGSQLCNAMSRSWLKQDLSPFHAEQILRARGEVIQEMNCRPVTVRARLGESANSKCYREGLPVMLGSEHLLMTANSRSLFEPAKILEVPCSEITAPFFISNDGTILVANPEVKTVNLALNHQRSPLMDTLDFDGSQDEEEIFTNLLYSSKELNSFTEYLHFQQVHSAAIQQMVGTYCAGNSDCGKYSPGKGYDFNLNNFEKELEEFDPFTQLDEWIRYLGAYGGFIILIWYIITIIYSLSTIVKYRCRGYFWKDSLQLTMRPRPHQPNYRQEMVPLNPPTVSPGTQHPPMPDDHQEPPQYPTLPEEAKLMMQPGQQRVHFQPAH